MRGRFAVAWVVAGFALVLALVGVSPWPSRARHAPVAAQVAIAASEQALARSHRHGQSRGLGTASATRCQPWRTVPSPDVGDLVALAAISADDIWAVGARGLLHWNGRHWRIVASPAAHGLSAIAAVSATDVWAVGQDSSRPLAIHWNGHRWYTVRVPMPRDAKSAAFYGIAAITSRDVWAVGIKNTYEATLAAHWDGTRWQIVPSPNEAGPHSQSQLFARRPLKHGRVGGG